MKSSPAKAKSRISHRPAAAARTFYFTLLTLLYFFCFNFNFESGMMDKVPVVNDL
jgi:hypothetical protein